MAASTKKVMAKKDDTDTKFKCLLCSKTLTGLQNVTKHQGGSSSNEGCVAKDAARAERDRKWLALDGQDTMKPRGSATNIYVGCAFPDCEEKFGFLDAIRDHYTTIHRSERYHPSAKRVSKSAGGARTPNLFPASNSYTPNGLPGIGMFDGNMGGNLAVGNLASFDFQSLGGGGSMPGTPPNNPALFPFSMAPAFVPHAGSSDPFGMQNQNQQLQQLQEEDALYQLLSGNNSAAATPSFPGSFLSPTMPQSQTQLSTARTGSGSSTKREHVDRQDRTPKRLHSDSLHPVIPQPPAAAATAPARASTLQRTVSEVNRGSVDLKAWLNPADMKTPVQKAIRGVHGDAFYGGAELRPRYWLLKEIRDWFEGALGQDELDVAFDEMDGVVAEAGTQVHEGRVFCLMGGAGTGKSAVAGMLMDDFASNQFASLESQSVYFFFKHDDEERNNAYSFVKTIAHQLAVLDPDGFQKRILKTQQETPDCIKQKKAELPSVKVILNELVLKPLHKLNPKITRLLVCIDALDECEPKSRAELIEALNDRQFELHPRVKLFVTTRPDASLELSGGVGKTRELTKVMNDRDLRAFAEAHICSTWTSGREKDRKEAKRIARALAEAADGLFVWLSLALKQIEVDKLTRLKTAQRIIDAGLSLNDLYTKALERIEGIQEGDGLELFHNVVGALLCLKKPVPLGTLDTLTGQNAEELLIGIAALLNELKEEEVVTFVHKSVPDFLTSNAAAVFRVDPSASNVSVAVQCLKVLCDNSEWSSNSSLFLIAEVFAGEISPFKLGLSKEDVALEYALSHWIDHVTDSFFCDANRPLLDTFREKHGAPALLACYKRKHFRFMIALLDFNESAQLRVAAESVEEEQEDGTLMRFLRAESAEERTSNGTKIPIMHVSLLCETIELRKPVVQNADEEVQDDDGQLKLCKLLVERANADVNGKGFASKSPLHCAAAIGDLALVSWLCEQDNIDLESRDARKFTPLHYASQNGRHKVVELLVSKGAEVDSRDNYDSTSMHYAVLHGHTAIAKFLLKNGAEANAKNKTGLTPLHFASRAGYVEVIETMLMSCPASKVSAMVNTVDNTAWSALHYAATAGMDAVVDFLLKYGANAQLKDGDGWTALHWAAEANKWKVVDQLRTMIQLDSLTEQWCSILCSGCKVTAKVGSKQYKCLAEGSVRYTCKECGGVDFCEACFENRHHLHPKHQLTLVEHPVLKIKKRYT